MANLQTTTELKGIALPATKGPGGYFQTKGVRDVAWGDLMQAIFTPQGSRPMNRAFGSVLHEQLFEPVVDLVDDGVIDFVVREAVSQFCPHLVVREVEILDSPAKSVHLVIKFALRSDSSNTQTREVQIDKSFISAGGV